MRVQTTGEQILCILALIWPIPRILLVQILQQDIFRILAQSGSDEQAITHFVLPAPHAVVQSPVALQRMQSCYSTGSQY